MSKGLIKMGATVARKSLNGAVDKLDHLERHLLKLKAGEEASEIQEKTCREIFDALAEVNNWLYAIENAD